jgi:Peptidase family M48
MLGLLFGIGGRDREGAQPAFALVLVVSVVAYAVSFVLMLALSRYREFVADRGAAMTTGRPSALAAALMKDLGRNGCCPRSRPARRGTAERVLHRARRREAHAAHVAVHASADAAACRRTRAPGGGVAAFPARQPMSNDAGCAMILAVSVSERASKRPAGRSPDGR